MSTTLEQSKLMTANELFEMPDDGFRYELVRGELRRSLLICIVYPKRRTVTVHRPTCEPQILTINDTLDLSDVVTGFKLPVNRIFT